MRQTETESGWVAGLPGRNTRLTVFRGIPYASPPVGPLRWRPPQPAAKWEGVYQAYYLETGAPQLIEEETPFYRREFHYDLPQKTDEDCLRLNVFTPAAHPGEGLPVMLYLHGGGFQTGFSFEPEYDGEGLAKRGVVVVFADYRLGILGFLAHPELSSENGGHSGNYGLMDQIFALHWVRRNIAAFGGDPNRITIFGQSAGAMSVMSLLCSPLVREGDVVGAIAQSGGGYVNDRLPFSHAFSPLKQAEQQGEEALRAHGADSIAAARALPVETLLAIQKSCVRFWPCVDGFVLPQTVGRAIESGTYRHVPLLLGSNRDESGLDYEYKTTHFSAGMVEAEVSRIRREYGPYAGAYLKVCEVEEKPLEFLLECGWSESLAPQALAWCLRTKRDPDMPRTYGYRFTRQMPGGIPCAFHSAELWYVFYTLPNCWRPLTGGDYELAGKLADYWTNFAKTGSPNGEGLPRWDSFQESGKLMRLDLEPGMTDDYGTKRARFIADAYLNTTDTGG